MSRQEVKQYCGKNISNEVISKINNIYILRNLQLLSENNYQSINSVEDLMDLCNAKLSQINIVLGEDWFIIYLKKTNYIEIALWYSLETEKDKFCQTMEMIKSLKQILLLSEYSKVIANMRLSTSYRFYHLFLEKGYFKEQYSYFNIEFPEDNDEDKFLEIIKSKYNTIEEYLSDESRKIYSEYEPYFFREAFFTITTKFKKRYKRKNNNQRNSSNQ